MLPSGSRPSFSHAVLKRVLLLAGLVGAGAAIFYAARFVEAVVLFSSIVGPNAISEDRARNDRGDEVMVSTEASGRWQDPDHTVVELRRAHHWFWTTLVEIKSFGIHENIEWRSDDALDLLLNFGCLVQMTHPLDRLGTIHIAYRLRDNERTLAKGCPN